MKVLEEGARRMESRTFPWAMKSSVARIAIDEDWKHVELNNYLR